jgi:hypothetical protein
MKPLELNPQKFEVELRMLEAERETKNDYGQMTVEFRFGDTSGTQVFLRNEMERIGRWFLSAAKRTKKLPKGSD